uniref:Uncharacterized protein n=1 Tax=Arundo donax TaxID=35708 RepID=A0A0A9E6J1_ARUDO
MHATGRCMFLCSGCRETPESRLMVWLLKLDLEINLFVLFISNFFFTEFMHGWLYLRCRGDVVQHRPGEQEGDGDGPRVAGGRP